MLECGNCGNVVDKIVHRCGEYKHTTYECSTCNTYYGLGSILYNGSIYNKYFPEELEAAHKRQLQEDKDNYMTPEYH